MNENIDLTKILKNCPEGFPLYSIIYGTVTFSKIINNTIEFIYSHETPYGIFKSTAWVNLKGNYVGSYSYNGECTLLPSKDQRDWSKFTASWYKEEKFDPKTLQSYDRVIVRNHDEDIWTCDLFSHIYSNFIYTCTGGCGYKQCIPYNDDTKHLVGTNDKAPEYYKYWED